MLCFQDRTNVPCMVHGAVHGVVWYMIWYGVVWYNLPCTMYQCTIGTWSGNGKVWVVVCSNGSSAGIADPATELLSSTLPRFLQNQNQFWSGRHHLLLYQKRLRSSLTIEHLQALQVSLNEKCESGWISFVGKMHGLHKLPTRIRVVERVWFQPTSQVSCASCTVLWFDFTCTCLDFKSNTW